jgi:hypothetical protein
LLLLLLLLVNGLAVWLLLHRLLLLWLWLLLVDVYRIVEGRGMHH